MITGDHRRRQLSAPQSVGPALDLVRDAPQPLFGAKVRHRHQAPPRQMQVAYQPRIAEHFVGGEQLGVLVLG